MSGKDPDDEAEWERATQGLATKFGNNILSDLDDTELSVMFCGLVLQAVTRGMLLADIHRAVDSAVAANGHIATGIGDA